MAASATTFFTWARSIFLLPRHSASRWAGIWSAVDRPGSREHGRRGIPRRRARLCDVGAGGGDRTFADRRLIGAGGIGDRQCHRHACRQFRRFQLLGGRHVRPRAHTPQVVADKAEASRILMMNIAGQVSDQDTMRLARLVSQDDGISPPAAGEPGERTPRRGWAMRRMRRARPPPSQRCGRLLPSVRRGGRRDGGDIGALGRRPHHVLSEAAGVRWFEEAARPGF